MNIKYSNNNEIAYFDGLNFRKDKKSGYYLSSKNIDGKRERLHCYVWEYYNGKIPKRMEVHHIDMNKDNNEIENLELLSKEEHTKKHAKEKTEQQKQKMRENVVKNAMPKAKEWHSTEQGKKWHSEHAKKIHENLPIKKYICTFCGKEFETKKNYANNQNHFCSNKCRSAYRRKIGVDNVVKICEGCGCEYVENKYQKTTLCKECRSKKNRNSSK